MKRKYRNYTEEQVRENAKNVTNLSQLLNSLDLKEAGGNYANMKRLLQKWNIDCSHWIIDRSWNRGKQLKDWSNYTRVTFLKKHLLKLKTNKCESCDNQTWMNETIPLEVHHIDGDRTNNELSNLQLLCCNCHALTDNWRNRKPKVLN